MTQAIDIHDFIRMMGGAIKIIKHNHQYLSRLDAETGDGDHGVTMLRAMNKVETLIAGTKTIEMKTLIYDIGWALLGIDGGSTGPLFGSLFMGMSDGMGDQGTLDGLAVATMFEAGLAAIQEQTKAKVGDKTMIDALIPAIDALRKSATEGKDIEAMFREAALAAETGASSTKALQAHFGRAKHQGTRTIGHQDPGATSTALIFQGFLDGLLAGLPTE
jgi:dihydroxyacetone kinase-like protein